MTCKKIQSYQTRLENQGMVISLFIQVVFDCAGRDALPWEIKLVQDQCDGKERCQFTPGPDFFKTSIYCGPGKFTKTWMTWRCNGNNNKMVNGNNNIDKKSPCESAKKGNQQSMDFHRGADWKKNKFDITCPGGCFETVKVW